MGIQQKAKGQGGGVILRQKLELSGWTDEVRGDYGDPEFVLSHCRPRAAASVSPWVPAMMAAR